MPYRKNAELTLFLSVVLFICAFPASTLAADVSVATEWLHTEYRETSTTGQTLNREDGGLPGLALQSRWRLRPALSAGLTASYHQGEVDYSGRTQTGRALETRTRTRFQEAGAWLGYRLPPEVVNLTLRGGILFRQWDRNIEATGSTIALESRYRWWTPEISVQLNHSLGRGQSFRIRAGVFRTTAVETRIDLTALGAGKTTLEPEGDYGQRYLVAWSMPATETLELSVYAYFERAAFASSDPVRLSTGSTIFSVSEPDSTRWRRGIGIGFSF
ncbi:hypothetical protein DES49_2136 [Halospina denitrificans]|uniref:Outer membrane protein with beta-barrel domain n=1 Tax=Halospina denitrificans TaxID=332522 RepID=A0A4R7JQF7_9GAMM|nr:hypothetical protein [Halospina denitrificans]TDT40370.1 hypothetical protein DES49_2136 [Halospina denitrificans]